MGEKLSVDLRAGGLGDVWMRLAGFHAAAALRPGIRVRAAVPEVLYDIACAGFGGRVEVVTAAEAGAVTYSVRGLRDLLPSALRGRRWAAPYGRVVIRDWNRWRLRDRLNSMAYAAADLCGLVYSPPWESLAWYQGYSEVVLLPALRNITPEEFNRQVAADLPDIARRVAHVAAECAVPGPEPIDGRVVVFPTGSARQFIPVEWAKANLPDAVIALHESEPDPGKWRDADLAVVIYSTPAQIAALGRRARIALTTDSFPSHVLQYAGAEVVVLITEAARHRVVSPGFAGHVVDAVAPCHPCPHLERRAAPRCKEGHEVCLNWESPVYTARVRGMLEDGRGKC
jgi:hypothetical protein